MWSHIRINEYRSGGMKQPKVLLINTPTLFERSFPNLFMSRSLDISLLHLHASSVTIVHNLQMCSNKYSSLYYRKMTKVNKDKVDDNRSVSKIGWNKKKNSLKLKSESPWNCGSVSQSVSQHLMVSSPLWGPSPDFQLRKVWLLRC
jgi:hypothetical protein